MLNPNVPKPTPGVSRLGSEFSSSQLVIATCVFLIMALVCFALGVIVGRYELNSSRPKQSIQTAEAVSESAKPLPPAARKEATAPAEEGVQKSPRPVVMPPVKAQTPGFPASSEAASAAKEHPVPAKPVTEATPAKAETPPAAPDAQKPPAPEAKLPEPAAAPVAETKTETPPASAALPPKEEPKAIPPAASTPVPPKEEPKPAPAASAPVPPKEEQKVAPLAQPPKTEQKAAQQPPAASSGGFGIQVASFSGPNRQKMAEQSKKRLESNSNLKGDLVTAEDGKMIRLIVGHYPDKESAVKACNELKQRAGFTDSFVRKR